MARREAATRAQPAGDGLRFPLYITREAMADCLGLTVGTVSRQISGLRREGFFTLPGNHSVHVHDLARLIDEAGDDADGGLAN